MSARGQVDREWLLDLLRRVAPHKASDLDKLVSERNPSFLLDSEEETILFQSNAQWNTITIGVKCTCRLQAHAIAGGIVMAALSTPGYDEMSSEERGVLYAPGDAILTWAVGRDLQQRLKQRERVERRLDEIMLGSETDLPDELLAALTEKQRVLGQGLFTFAIAFILLHELAHLYMGHVGCTEIDSILQEKGADRFAAEWLLESPALTSERRLNCLSGIAVALLWLTVLTVFLGPGRSRSHPSAYDRLFQVLDLAICSDDEVESLMVWHFVSQMLFIHMDTAEYQFEESRMQGTPRDQTNYLIDLISKHYDK